MQPDYKARICGGFARSCNPFRPTNLQQWQKKKNANKEAGIISGAASASQQWLSTYSQHNISPALNNSYTRPSRPYVTSQYPSSCRQKGRERRHHYLSPATNRRHAFCSSPLLIQSWGGKRCDVLYSLRCLNTKT